MIARTLTARRRPRGPGALLAPLAARLYLGRPELSELIADITGFDGEIDDVPITIELLEISEVRLRRRTVTGRQKTEREEEREPLEGEGTLMRDLHGLPRCIRRWDPRVTRFVSSHSIFPSDFVLPDRRVTHRYPRCSSDLC